MNSLNFRFGFEFFMKQNIGLKHSINFSIFF